MRVVSLLNSGAVVQIEDKVSYLSSFAQSSCFIFILVKRTG